jgi:hypothetical protein
MMPTALTCDHKGLKPLTCGYAAPSRGLRIYLEPR